MTTIHKYPLRAETTQTIHTHEGAEVLHAGTDPAGEPCVWAKVDTTKPEAHLLIHCYWTGDDIQHDNLQHVSSFTAGAFVWHVFTSEPPIVPTRTTSTRLLRVSDYEFTTPQHYQ